MNMDIQPLPFRPLRGLISSGTALVVVLVEVVCARRSIAWDLPLDPEEKG
jgi:hypothetical protein